MSTCRGGGYRYCRTDPPHPRANSKGLYPLHRVLAENKIGRLLDASEHVHHVDGDKSNDAPENLLAVTAAEHTRIHRHGGDLLALTCPVCERSFALRPHVARQRAARAKSVTCSRSCGAVMAKRTNRDPLTDPRPGDIVADADGVVLEVVDVLLGRGAYVHVREDSARYRVTHEGWRLITAGGRVIHAARSRDPLTDPRAGDVVADSRGNEMTIIDSNGVAVWWSEVWGDKSLKYTEPVGRYQTLVAGGCVIHAAEGQA